ncbi:hypothetical protein ZWY2020_000047 [Hordeum vulgare]|nr:hypothetical protein ZWY2020_000047 [Hordeum vulgare]
MVDADAVVAWGPAGNSFVAADSFAFSKMLLPPHFKPANFSRFVRQLNTYGFRKVDRDRWEFAHASFLRGQTHILRHIVRHQSNTKHGKGDIEDDDEDKSSSSEMLAMEVARLRNEQRATEERVTAMWRQVQEAKRRPKQMLAFVLRVVGDPDVLRRLVDSSGSGRARARRSRGRGCSSTATARGSTGCRTTAAATTRARRRPWCRSRAWTCTSPVATGSATCRWTAPRPTAFTWTAATDCFPGRRLSVPVPVYVCR